MANIFTYEVLRDTTEKTVIKLTGKFDGTGQESNVSRIQANTLYGALDANGVPLYTSLSVSNTALSYYGLALTRVGYNIASKQQGYVELFWNGTTPSTILTLDVCGTYSEEQGMVSIKNNAVNPTGDIGIASYGFTANCAYSLVLELRKDNRMYDRGQFSDPAAFNYPPYGITPA